MRRAGDNCSGVSSSIERKGIDEAVEVAGSSSVEEESRVVVEIVEVVVVLRGERRKGNKFKGTLYQRSEERERERERKRERRRNTGATVACLGLAVPTPVRRPYGVRTFAASVLLVGRYPYRMLPYVTKSRGKL